MLAHGGSVCDLVEGKGAFLSQTVCLTVAKHSDIIPRLCRQLLHGGLYTGQICVSVFGKPMNIGHLLLVPGDIPNDKLQRGIQVYNGAGLANTGIKGPGKLQEHIRVILHLGIAHTGDGQDLVGREILPDFLERINKLAGFTGAGKGDDKGPGHHVGVPLWMNQKITCGDAYCRNILGEI